MNEAEFLVMKKQVKHLKQDVLFQQNETIRIKRELDAMRASGAYRLALKIAKIKKKLLRH